SAETQVLAADPAGRELLGAWAREQVATLGPAAWGRALFDEDTHEQMHLTAETGLPTFHMGPLPDLLLRERIEDTSAASLARFNVRWVIGLNRSPAIGNPDTEVVLGSYHIRTLDTWDGKFARLEKGTGEVKVLRLDAEAVEIEVTGTTAPVLVALGTGFYPRWRATHASGADEPVHALPTIPGGKLHVVSAWVAPGKTTFTVDAPLPSDHDGLVLSILALAFALAAIIVWRIPRLRTRLLRRVVTLRARIPVAPIARFGVPLVILALVLRATLDWQGPAKDLGVGSGLRPLATVEARVPDGEWQDCGYSRVMGEYRCPGLVTVYDATANLLNDAPPSWPFVTPAIVASPDDSCEVRIYVRARLDGTYWAAATGVTDLAIDGEPQRQIGGHEELTYEGHADRSVGLRTSLLAGYNYSFVFVRADTLVPDRPFLAPPPLEAPAAIRAIR
ncbi:MAG: hypothetical protein H0T79_07295, partial [Deltaproteobacteria bacterium]|nr:hypothetical protein [Deltaproteobacteria bacterium]